VSDTMQKEVPSSLAPRGMAHIPGGVFRMGSDSHYLEEAPSHLVKVDKFWIDWTPVTNREFRKFVNATGYVTFAEIAPDPKHYPGALPHRRSGPQRLEPMVEFQVRLQLAPALRAALLDQRT
jgi:formylglycine-generating enzyme